ncbi:hypothetical protein ACIPLC_37435 [Kitasatospora sp. NPDC086801]|uniref:hypothetical protein n=1 Tax=Kitasatospora sp. NPDC086801 TaxID=3364066 RepID=UPI0037FAEBDD
MPQRRFLRWCTDSGHLPKLKHTPQAVGSRNASLDHAGRATDLRRVLQDDGLPLRTRIAAALVLLYAQPVTRLVRLTTDHITDDGSTISIAFGDPPSLLPQPVADLIRTHLKAAGRMHRASPRSAHWLFPGRQAGQPMSPGALREHLQAAGTSPRSARVTALRYYLQHAPPPVVTKALGYTQATTAYVAMEVGAPWSRYAPGDHSRRGNAGTLRSGHGAGASEVGRQLPMQLKLENDFEVERHADSGGGRRSCSVHQTRSRRQSHRGRCRPAVYKGLVHGGPPQAGARSDIGQPKLGQPVGQQAVMATGPCAVGDDRRRS